jgi:proteasome lid subunit RPN8/RPN11
LRFSPTAWAKLQFFCHREDVEIGGFGISSADDLLCIDAFATVKQDVTMASVRFDDEAVADFFETQVDAGREPEQFARCWLHTHPGDSATPSLTDEETFARVFGASDWAVMVIVARTGKTYARMRFNVGPGGEVAIPVDVDFTLPFGASDHEAWKAEYEANIHPALSCPAVGDSLWAPAQPLHGDDWEDLRRQDEGLGLMPDDWLEEFSAMDQAEREFVLDELEHHCQE